MKIIVIPCARQLVFKTRVLPVIEKDQRRGFRNRYLKNPNNGSNPLRTKNKVTHTICPYQRRIAKTLLTPIFYLGKLKN